MTPSKILKLKVKNFRNLAFETIEFGPKVNCILGGNGHGKTNILEAIYVLSTKKSFRKKTSFPQFLSIDGEKPEIIFTSLLTAKNDEFSYSAKITHESFEVFHNGKPVKKKLDIPIIFINPFDSFSFYNKASERRKWIDQHLSTLDKNYKVELKRYQTLLKFRNALLEQNPSGLDKQLNAVDEDFVGTSGRLTARRIKFITEIEGYYADAFNQIFSENHRVSLHLQTKIAPENPDKLREILAKNRPKDRYAKFTTYGVHKDDYILLFDGMNSTDFCSLGQQKMSYLSLLFAYIELFRYKIGSFPIVLMDDVSGELDQARWENLVRYLGNADFQTLITTANDAFRRELERIEGTKKILVTSGFVKNL